MFRSDALIFRVKRKFVWALHFYSCASRHPMSLEFAGHQQLSLINPTEDASTIGRKGIYLSCRRQSSTDTAPIHELLDYQHGRDSSLFGIKFNHCQKWIKGSHYLWHRGTQMTFYCNLVQLQARCFSHSWPPRQRHGDFREPTAVTVLLLTTLLGLLVVPDTRKQMLKFMQSCAQSVSA